MKQYVVKIKFRGLGEQYEICEDCKGFGGTSSKKDEKIAIIGKDYRIIKCKKCNGRGYITFIEKVFGVK